MIEFTTEKFSGPLGLLLQLIEGEKLDITEINLAKIADQYVEHIKTLEDTDAEEMADFLVIAAKLLFIKSKALLPTLTVFPVKVKGEPLKVTIPDIMRLLKLSSQTDPYLRRIQDKPSPPASFQSWFRG